MKKTIKINVPLGCEVRKTGCDSIEIIFPDGVKDNPVLKVEADRLPYSWEEFCEMHPVQNGECFIGKRAEIHEAEERRRKENYDKNQLPNKKTAEAFLAMMQLIQLRNCYNGGWEPDWEDSEERKYVIVINENKIESSYLSTTSCPLAFRTEERRDLFIRNFRDLIEIAKPLL